MNVFGEVIYAYTRKQAIEDGVLVDVSRWACPPQMDGGFKVPVAMTAGLWALLGTPDVRQESAPLAVRDVLWQAVFAARRGRGEDRVSFIVRIGDEDVELVLHIGPGDTRKLVATIMLPGED